jgi:hypothetical protein
VSVRAKSFTDFLAVLPREHPRLGMGRCKAAAFREHAKKHPYYPAHLENFRKALAAERRVFLNSGRVSS